MPADADESVAAEKHDRVERQLHHEEEAGGVGASLELLSGAVAEEEDGQGAEPEQEGRHRALQDFIESSHHF